MFFFYKNKIIFFFFFCTNFVDFLTNSSENAESNDFVPEQPLNENPEISALSNQQGENLLWYIFLQYTSSALPVFCLSNLGCLCK